LPIFLDTSFIAAYLNKDDSNNKQATQIWIKILENTWGYPITSDYVVSECFTLLLSRKKNLLLLRKLYSFIHGNERSGDPKIIHFHKVTQKVYEDTWKTFEQYNDPKLSFTDLTILEVCKNLKIQYLASYDSDFKGKIALIP
jgi:predicted nucleic acid-binding protein